MRNLSSVRSSWAKLGALINCSPKLNAKVRSLLRNLMIYSLLVNKILQVNALGLEIGDIALKSEVGGVDGLQGQQGDNANSSPDRSRPQSAGRGRIGGIILIGLGVGNSS